MHGSSSEGSLSATASMELEEGPPAMVRALLRATNAHDLDAVGRCFSPDYRNETPAHPDRNFAGRDQVGDNWRQIFAFVPDLTCEVLRWAVEGDTVWTEWEHRGNRRDGSPHLMRGVVIFGLDGDRAAWARFYLEPVRHDGMGVGEFVRRQVGSEVVA